MYTNQIAQKDAEIGQLKSERYTDQSQLDLRDRIAALNKDVIGYVVDLGQKAAVAEERNTCLAGKVKELQTFATDTSKELSNILVREQRTNDAIDCLAKTTSDKFDAVYSTINCVKRECGDAIALEAEKRINGDQSIRCYVDSHFVPGALYLSSDSVTPKPMPEKNSWTVPCNCGCSCGCSK